MRWFWIDRFIEFERGRRAVALKCVSMAEEQIDDYCPGNPFMPHSLIIEGLAQTAGLLIGESGGFEARVVLAKVSKAVFHRMAMPGDQLRYTAALQSVSKDGAIANCTSHIGDQLQAEVDLMFAFLDDRFPSGPLFEPAEFVVLCHSFGMYDVGKTETGEPIQLPKFYQDAQTAALATYSEERPKSSVVVEPSATTAGASSSS
ncbi:Beta-hydroxyacyl-(acyl-carrier-protein) dehydratase FabA/FabZ [Pirellula staleyi DSM 6068]|uniref:Beta-hydroxyacyl-(Acyl-carrier-protein) dehydratase FabA/FabZ n=1 Tax=Pirellula staleyi (strain ATCC 27377 / DSM 6068 / ICPB 4128) TaxID=530564 RepID=D2QY50_PIRSD|nr:3-hydroxyacyl-ACP dehydratase FabZ family protein [Pirellula staleyi]ADB16264.1 Beta-hydroxyacyl-(acyl-carrier-protein) dehydratase FabA/FabZ [Pirellula staleyi DSM 6068]